MIAEATMQESPRQGEMASRPRLPPPWSAGALRTDVLLILETNRTYKTPRSASLYSVLWVVI
jgi:hypothetical protein